MQEEVEQRAVTLAINTSKMSARVLKAAISRYLAHRKEVKGRQTRAAPVKLRDKPPTKPMGKQSVKQLIGQNQGVASIEITNRNIKSFERVARKYGVDFALKKDRSGDKPRYLVFFKARDGDALTAAFKEFCAKDERHREKPSIVQTLRRMREQEAGREAPKARKKELETR